MMIQQFLSTRNTRYVYYSTLINSSADVVRQVRGLRVGGKISGLSVDRSLQEKRVEIWSWVLEIPPTTCVENGDTSAKQKSRDKAHNAFTTKLNVILCNLIFFAVHFCFCALCILDGLPLLEWYYYYYWKLQIVATKLLRKMKKAYFSPDSFRFYK